MASSFLHSGTIISLLSSFAKIISACNMRAIQNASKKWCFGVELGRLGRAVTKPSHYRLSSVKIGHLSDERVAKAVKIII